MVSLSLLAHRFDKVGSSLTDLTGIDLSYSYQALGGVGSTSHSSKVQDVGKAVTPIELEATCTVRGCQGVWQGLSPHATGLRWQVLSVQSRKPNDKSKTTPGTDQMIFTNAVSRAEYTVMVSKILPTNCVQAHDDI